MKEIAEFAREWRFLSNFYPVKIRWMGATYPSVENAYQATKTNDVEDRLMFENCTPAQAKKWGSPNGRIKIRSDWDKIKLEIMGALVRIKFEEFPLRLALLKTENARLAEGNWWGDKYWGEVEGKGENHLGKILMEVRKELQDAEKVLSRKAREESSARKRRPSTASKSNSRQKAKARKA